MLCIFYSQTVPPILMKLCMWFRHIQRKVLKQFPKNSIHKQIFFINTTVFGQRSGPSGEFIELIIQFHLIHSVSFQPYLKKIVELYGCSDMSLGTKQTSVDFYGCPPRKPGLTHLGVTGVVGVIISHVKRLQCRQCMQYTHFRASEWGEMRTVPARQLMMMMLGGMAGLLVTRPPAAALPLVPTGRTGGGTPTQCLTYPAAPIFTT